MPLLLTPGSAMLLVTAMALLCYREYARATGLFRCRLLSALVVTGIVLLGAASLDHWYNFFVALTPLTITVLAAAGVLADSPNGYIQRVALAVCAFLLFGSGFMHLAYLANDRAYRPILCLLLLGVQLSDVLAYVCGKALGRRRLFPNTSPNKTLEGHAGSLLIVAPLVAWLAHLVFRGSAMDRPLVLAAFGLLVAAGAQLGDLVVGSIKRDIGIKDMGAALPGHGGLLDRFNSLLLVAPAAFHFVAYFVGVAMDRPPHALLPP